VECIHHTQIEQQPLDPPLPNTSPADLSEDNHSIPIIQIDDNDAADIPVANSPHVTRHRLMMERDIGAPVRGVFFINGAGGDVDYYEGKAHSITANYKQKYSVGKTVLQLRCSIMHTPSGQCIFEIQGSGKHMAHNLCDHTPCPGGLVVCQVATLTAAAEGSPRYSEGYEILLLNKFVYRNTQCFRR
jgi:hypothetical protein